MLLALSFVRLFCFIEISSKTARGFPRPNEISVKTSCGFAHPKGIFAKTSCGWKSPKGISVKTSRGFAYPNEISLKTARGGKRPSEKSVKTAKRALFLKVLSCELFSASALIEQSPKQVLQGQRIFTLALIFRIFVIYDISLLWRKT